MNKKELKKKKKNRGQRKRKNASPPTQFMHSSCPNFLDELARKHSLYTRNTVSLLVEGAKFWFLIF